MHLYVCVSPKFFTCDLNNMVELGVGRADRDVGKFGTLFKLSWKCFVEVGQCVLPGRQPTCFRKRLEWQCLKKLLCDHVAVSGL